MSEVYVSTAEAVIETQDNYGFCLGLTGCKDITSHLKMMVQPLHYKLSVSTMMVLCHEFCSMKKREKELPDLRITLDTTPDIEYEENNLRRYKQRKVFSKCQNRQFSY